MINPVEGEVTIKKSKECVIICETMGAKTLGD